MSVPLLPRIQGYATHRPIHTRTAHHYNNVHTIYVRNVSQCIAHKHHHHSTTSKWKIHITFFGCLDLVCVRERNGAIQQTKHRNKINKRRRRVNALAVTHILGNPFHSTIPLLFFFFFSFWFLLLGSMLFCCRHSVPSAFSSLIVVRLHEIAPFNVQRCRFTSNTLHISTPIPRCGRCDRCAQIYRLQAIHTIHIWTYIGKWENICLWFFSCSESDALSPWLHFGMHFEHCLAEIRKNRRLPRHTLCQFTRGTRTTK